MRSPFAVVPEHVTFPGQITCVEEQSVRLCGLEEHGQVVAGAGYGAAARVGQVVRHVLPSAERRLRGRLLCEHNGAAVTLTVPRSEATGCPSHYSMPSAPGSATQPVIEPKREYSCVGVRGLVLVPAVPLPQCGTHVAQLAQITCHTLYHNTNEH